MSAGFKYNVQPHKVMDEICDVQTLHHKRGAYKLETEGLTIGTTLPRFAPVRADLQKRTCSLVKNVRVVEAANAEATTLKIAKSSAAYVGMFVGTGDEGAKIDAIDTSDAAFDLLTLNEALGAKVGSGDVLFEATAVDGTTPKQTANFVIYEQTKVEEGGSLVALTMQAFEIQSDKLLLPISEKDKETLTARFQFD